MTQYDNLVSDLLTVANDAHLHDDVDVRKALAQTLVNHKVVTAPDGGEALAIAPGHVAWTCPEHPNDHELSIIGAALMVLDHLADDRRRRGAVAYIAERHGVPTNGREVVASGVVTVHDLDTLTVDLDAGTPTVLRRGTRVEIVAGN